MIVSPTDNAQPANRPARPGIRGSWAALLILALGLCSCKEAPLPERKLQVGDCLHRIDLDHLKEALQRCDRVVQAFPQHPQPRNERFLLHALMGQDKAACRDIAEADQLARRLPKGLDPLLQEELKLRLASCRN